MTLTDRIALKLWLALEPRLRRMLAERCRAAAVVAVQGRRHWIVAEALGVLADELERGAA